MDKTTKELEEIGREVDITTPPNDIYVHHYYITRISKNLKTYKKTASLCSGTRKVPVDMIPEIMRRAIRDDEQTGYKTIGFQLHSSMKKARSFLEHYNVPNFAKWALKRLRGEFIT